MSTIDDIFDRIVNESADKREQGTRFERAVKWFLQNDPSWQERLTDVWMWDEAPSEITHGRPDTGIDLVAKEEDGTYWAIQAKCYTKTSLSRADADSFFAQALADGIYDHYMIADTATKYSSNLEEFLNGHPNQSFVRLDIDTLRESNLDWEAYEQGEASAMRHTFDPKPHQVEAIEAVTKELANADRTTIVMACGTGKTLTALRLAEQLPGNGGTILFLAPSISLVSQTMRNWVNQTRTRINTYVVCSDGKASHVDEEAYGVLTDVPFPATTNPVTIASRFNIKQNAINVIFSTYQSLQVIHKAQELGLPDIDLLICDEAHRTTGVVEEGDESFRAVHDNDYIHASKRLYMTATPRIFDEPAKNKAREGAIIVASMDDKDTYGNVCYHLSFGKAVDAGLLTDYKVVVMQVSEAMMGRAMQRIYGAQDSEIPLDDAAKFVGCWKALFDRRHAKTYDANTADSIGKHAAATTENDDNNRVLHHAIAFARSIKASEALAHKFRTVIADYTHNLEDTGENKALVKAQAEVVVDVRHVDGTMDAPTRKERLDWLAEDTADNECHILSNARCLAEGIDVPDLDAVIYFNSRKSKVDIIQSVGRVMRRAPGKEFGYIIIPVVVPIGADPGTILSSSNYKPVWDVITALRSHDERLDAIINNAALGDADALNRIMEVEILTSDRLKKTRKDKPTEKLGEDGTDWDGADSSTSKDKREEEYATQAELDLDMGELAKGLNAQIVRKCGTKIYWGEWTADIANITQARAEKIATIVDTEPARSAFLEFVDGLRDSLNPGYSETEAIAVLAQHEVTKPIFRTLFTNAEVLENNPIVKGLDRALASLYANGLPDDLVTDPTLRDLYETVQVIAAQVKSDVAKQNLIKEIYNEFFSKAFKDTADSLGIVYTPVEVVDAQLHMVQRALRREFHQNLGDRNVHILDGFAGTGTYICRLIEDESLISDEDLPYKYRHDLHSNEIVPLAATIMDINIEQSYHKRIGGEYEAFPGALLTDTFQMHEAGNTLDDTVFTENTARVQAQKDTPIKIIIGNPPYRAGDSDNTGNQNTKYPSLDHRVETTYVAESNATLNSKLYDHYIRAFRWASDRIGNSGIVCFVSNGGWLTGESTAGVRKCFHNEFNDIYVYNLRGNQRTSGEESRREGGKIFDSGSRATIAITMLVKNPASDHHGVIHYRDIGDYLTRDEKLAILGDAVSADPEWTIITQDKHGDWLDKRDDSINRFIPIKAMFNVSSLGASTNRDTWVWNFDKTRLLTNAKTMTDAYNESVSTGIEINDDTRIKWTAGLKQRFKRKADVAFNADAIVIGAYRPFTHQRLYFNQQVIERPSNQSKIFPTPDTQNIEISMTGTGNNGFSCIAVNRIPCLDLMQKSQCFPLYYYESAEPEDTRIGYGTLFGEAQGELTLDENATSGDEPRYVRHDAITNTALKVFREAYPHYRISKEDIFYYVYGILHSPEYRKRFENNLKKELPRIPLAADFKAFMKAGRELAELHINYEYIERWSVHEEGNKENPGPTVKMSYPVKKKDPETGKKVPDTTILQVAENLTIHGIPERAYKYVVNGKSAIGWLIDRYKITTDKKSGITNDPNQYSDDPRYIVDLVERIITVSMKTLNIVEALPPLNEMPQPANWPQEWKTA